MSQFTSPEWKNFHWKVEWTLLRFLVAKESLRTFLMISVLDRWQKYKNSSKKKEALRIPSNNEYIWDSSLKKKCSVKLIWLDFLCFAIGTMFSKFCSKHSGFWELQKIPPMRIKVDARLTPGFFPPSNLRTKRLTVVIWSSDCLKKVAKLHRKSCFFF